MCPICGAPYPCLKHGRAALRRFVESLAQWADTWFCFYCGAPFGSQVELGAHLASCGRNR
jgi:hypothetical protein